MDQVGSVCACSRSQSLALPGEKALPVGYPDGRDSRICNRNLFGGALMQRRTAVTMRQDADVSQQHFAPISRLKRVVPRSERISTIPRLNSSFNGLEASVLVPFGGLEVPLPGHILRGSSSTRKQSPTCRAALATDLAAVGSRPSIGHRGRPVQIGVLGRWHGNCARRHVPCYAPARNSPGIEFSILRKGARTKGVSVSTSRLFLGEGQTGIGIQRNIGEDSRAKPRICRRGDHGRVIRRKRPAGKKYFDARGPRAL